MNIQSVEIADLGPDGLWLHIYRDGAPLAETLLYHPNQVLIGSPRDVCITTARRVVTAIRETLAAPMVRVVRVTWKDRMVRFLKGMWS